VPAANPGLLISNVCVAAAFSEPIWSAEFHAWGVCSMSGDTRLNRMRKPARLKPDLSAIPIVLFALAGIAFRETLINAVAGGDGREHGCFGQIPS
jgi:hypothetical protein